MTVEDDAAALIKRTRTDRGLPDHITDPAAIAKVAAAIRAADPAVLNTNPDRP